MISQENNENDTFSELGDDYFHHSAGDTFYLAQNSDGCYFWDPKNHQGIPIYTMWGPQ